MLKRLVCAGVSACIAVSLVGEVCQAIEVIPAKYIFRNPDTVRATDFSVEILNPPPYFDPRKSTGGDVFPRIITQGVPAGVTKLTFLAATFSDGIPPGGLYGFDLSDFPSGTSFDVKFSYFLSDDGDPVITRVFSSEDDFARALADLGVPPETVGRVSPASVPESSATLSLLALGIVGAGNLWLNRQRLSRLIG